MAPRTKKVNIYPTETKPDQISLLSQDIDDMSILQITTVIMTPENNNPKKTEKMDTRKDPKID